MAEYFAREKMQSSGYLLCETLVSSELLSVKAEAFCLA